MGIFRLALVLGLSAASVLAFEPPGMQPVPGLPLGGAEEYRLFQYEKPLKAFVEINPATAVSDRLYVRWYGQVGYYVWVTGNDRRMIVNGSKVHGARLGLTGQSGKNWFRLTGPAHNEWKWVTDRDVPRTWRWTPETGKVLAEEYAPGWEKIGGVLDPLPTEPLPQPQPPTPKPPVPEPPKPEPPPVKPPVTPPTPAPQPPPVTPEPPVQPQPGTLGCRITISPPTVKLGESVVLTMTTTGPVVEAVLDGAAVDFPVVRRLKVAALSGLNTVTGSVKAVRGETAGCEGTFQVAPDGVQTSVSLLFR